MTIETAPICKNPIFSVEKDAGRYVVRDLRNGQHVRFSYQEVLYGVEYWGNYYAARGFAQKLQKQIAGDCFAA